LAETLQSVLAQTYALTEVIVVDDGSSDGSAQLAESFGPPVRVIRCPHRGIGATRQEGVAAAVGELIAMNDADDLWHPDKLGRQVTRVEQHPEADGSLVTAENFWEAGMAAEEAQYRALGRLRTTHVFAALLAHRNVFETVPLDVTCVSAEGVDWFTRAAEAGLRFDVVTDVLVHRRMHPGSTTHTGATYDSYLDVVGAALHRRRAASASPD
jgi:glycosyltransferase involved in cell wall biosynthesis